ncbi:MAG: hypothetical protein FWG73_01130 [Planctomycetaceae bacterium]|nr:hypothetical protein [Planctomycetaceae bacterium]
MTSSIHKKLTGAAITLGGISSAYAQFYNDSLPEDPMIEETEQFDGTAEQMHGDSEGHCRLHQHVLR